MKISLKSCQHQIIINYSTFLIDTVTGFAPLEWQSNLGPLLVLRPQNGETANHFNSFDVEIVWDFINIILDEFGEGPGAVQPNLDFTNMKLCEFTESYVKNHNNGKQLQNIIPGLIMPWMIDDMDKKFIKNQEKWVKTDEELKREVSQEMLDQFKFVSSHSWPSEKNIRRYILNENDQYTHGFPLKDFGPLFYNHDLAKELWKVVEIKEDFPNKSKAYRLMGYKIYLHGRNVSRGEEFQCMQFYFYLIQHVLCGNEVFPETEEGAKGRFANASTIEHAWDGIGPWMA